MSPSQCRLDEQYGAIKVLEDEILLLKREDWNWGIEVIDSIRQTLPATAFLACTRKDLVSAHSTEIIQITDLAELELSTDYDFLISYLLGLASQVILHQVTLSEASSNIISKLRNFSNFSLKYQVAILFSCTLFYNLVRLSFLEEPERIRLFVVKESEILREEFAKDEFQNLRVKYLYILSSFSGSTSILDDIYSNYKALVLSLRNQSLRDDEKIFLVKPYAYLRIDCHKSIISEIMSHVYENEYAMVQQHLLHNISIYFTYGYHDRSLIQVTDFDDNYSLLQAKISQSELTSLNQLPFNPSFLAMIGIALITSGYMLVSVLPEDEGHLYTQFLINQDSSKRIIQERKLNDAASTYAESEFRFRLVTSFLLLIFVLGLAYIVFLYTDLLNSISLISLFVGYQIYSTLSKTISATSRSIASLIVHRKIIKEKLINSFLTIVED